VDTATHPDAQRQGVFRELTRRALDELADEGIDFVFNTPNDRSRPGYLDMGWEVVGRPRLHVQLESLRSVTRIGRARVPAAKWSEPAGFGVDPATAFVDDDEVWDALRGLAPDRLTTNRSARYLRWRYGFGPLRYRVVRQGEALSDGFAVVRLRRRGPAVEGAVCEVVVPGGDRRVISDLLGQVKGADYLVRLGAGRALLRGPTVIARAVAQNPPGALDRWHLSLGDLELL
jgi:hypothetical protein